MSKSTILVTGATGQQGGAAARHLQDAGFNVRTFVRNPSSAASQAIALKGVEVVTGDFGQPESLRRAMVGVDGVFSVQPFLPGKAALEIQWGKAVADAAAAARVSHFVYTSVLGSDLAPDVPHFACKAVIEKHIESTGMQHTILQPGGFMENLLMPVVLKGISKGKLTAPNQVDSLQPLIAIDDIGTITAIVFANPEAYSGKKIPLAGDLLSTRDQAETLARVLGRPIRPGQLPAIVVRLFLGRDLYRMFRWIDTNGSRLPLNMDALRLIHPGLSSFEHWCRHTLIEALRLRD